MSLHRNAISLAFLGMMISAHHASAQHTPLEVAILHRSGLLTTFAVWDSSTWKALKLFDALDQSDRTWSRAHRGTWYLHGLNGEVRTVQAYETVRLLQFPWTWALTTDQPRDSSARIPGYPHGLGMALSRDLPVTLLAAADSTAFDRTLRVALARQLEHEIGVAIDSAESLARIPGIRAVRIRPADLELGRVHQATLPNGQIIGHADASVSRLVGIPHRTDAVNCPGFATLSAWWTVSESGVLLTPRYVDIYPCDEMREQINSMVPLGVIDLGGTYAILGVVYVWKDDGFNFVTTFDGATFRSEEFRPWRWR